MSPRRDGQGSHTLKPEKRERSLLPSWTQVLDRWGPKPRGYALGLFCACPVFKLNGAHAGRQEWCLPETPTPPELRRRPVYSALREGDPCPACQQPITRGRKPEPLDDDLRAALVALAPLAPTVAGTVVDVPEAQRSLNPAAEGSTKEAVSLNRQPSARPHQPTMWEEQARVAAARRLRSVE